MFAITERLLLRPGWIEDAPALSRAIGDHAVIRNLSRVPWPYALGDAERFLSLPQQADRPRFLITLRDGGALVGGIGIHDGNGAPDPEIGYWLARAHWGKGYATEAGRAVVEMADASLRLPRLFARHALDNPASGQVLAKLGFVPNGHGRMPSLGRGGDVDVRHFAREREAWGSQPEPLAA